MKLFIIRGLPGSGKSTKARQMLREGQITKHLESDMYFESTEGYIFDKDKLPEAHAWCRKECRKALERGENIAVTNTFIRRWEAQDYFDMAMEYGADVKVIECKESYGSIHDVPEAVLKIMKENWEEF